MEQFKGIFFQKLFLIKIIFFLILISSKVHGQQATYSGVKSTGDAGGKHGFSSTYSESDDTFSNWFNTGETPRAYSLIGANNKHGGFGIVEGNHIASPMVWMYEFSGRNAFMVNKAPYGGKMSTSINLFTVRENGKVGLGTIYPESKLHIKNGQLKVVQGGDGDDFDATRIAGFRGADGSGNGWVEIWGDVNKKAGILFGNPTDGWQGRLHWDAAASHLAFYAGKNQANTQHMTLTNDGFLGIGTAYPKEKLEIISSGGDGLGIRNANEPINTWGLKILQKDDLQGRIEMAGQDLQINSGYDKKLILGHPMYDDASTAGKGKVVIPWGKVGIGTEDTSNGNYKLYVKDGIRTEKVKVDVSSNWADFVFEEDYQLRSLEEVETFVKENKHLPEIPSANEVEEEGIDLGAMDAKLLQKIEELTLYMIEQDKKVNTLIKKVEQLEKENQELKSKK